MITELVDTLREQVLHVRGLRTLEEIAEDLDITRQTLVRFLRGGSASMGTITAIERWLATQGAPREPR